VGAAAAQYVFGYGSLVAGAPMHPARLRGHRRVWGVAMDNSVDIPGYKSYRSSLDGSRPEVFVAFLDIVEDAGASTGGSLIAVDDALLGALDARERNYDRIDVTGQIEGGPPDATVWTYRGTVAGRARLDRAKRDGNAAVDVEYVLSIRTAMHALGFGPEAENEGWVDPDPLRLMVLDRVEIPPDRAP
jgi:hypothetical protein